MKRQRVERAKAERARELRRRMTPEEGILWERLRANRLRGLHFRRQQVVEGFIADFYCDLLGLVVEVDGPVHEAQVEADAERDAVLSARGLRILRVTNDEVRGDLSGVLARIALHAEQSPAGLPLPPRSKDGEPAACRLYEQSPARLPLPPRGRGPGG